MIKSATRRFASRKAERDFNYESFNKDGMNSARRVLDKALVEEAVKAMTEPEPEADYFMVEWDYPDWDIEGVYDNYKDAELAAKTCGGNMCLTNKAEFEYHKLWSDRYWEDRYHWEDAEDRLARKLAE